MKSVYMKLSDRRCSFILFIAITQILYGTMDIYVDCIVWYCPRGMMLVDKYPYRPVCIPNKGPAQFEQKVGQYPSIVSSPCPSGLRANEYGNCRQFLN